MAPGKDGKYDFFVSRRGSAATVAQEVADVLASAGYSSFSQDYDIGHGANFVAEIHKALKGCQHFIALLTLDYDEALYTLTEWTNFYKAAIESNGTRRFIVIRVEACDPPGLLAGIVFADLVGVRDPHERRKRILAAAGGHSIAEPTGTRLFENVPPRDLNFTGRDERLAELHALLTDVGKPTAITQAAIHGLGGIGKTSLATEYAHRYPSAYSGVWWANAEQRTVLVASLAALAGRLDRRLAEEPDQEKAARAAIVLLSGRGGLPILLIYDNVENPQTLNGLLPSAGARLLVTTRWTDWGGRAAELKLEVLPPANASEFLQKRAARTDPVGAGRLATALGNLPLALDHAGAYCKLTGSSFDAYRNKIDGLINRVPKGATHPSVFATFSLAVEKATVECRTAEVLLGFFAFLAPENIPLYLVDDNIISKSDLPEVLAALASVSLIEHVTLEDASPGVTLHRLVQAAMRARIAERGQVSAVAATATEQLANAFPKGAYKNPKCWPLCATLLPHVLALREHKLWGAEPTEEAAYLFSCTGNYLMGRAAFAEAEPLASEALTIGQKVLGREHGHVASYLNNLANLLCETSREAEAEPLLREAITIGEKVVGRNSPIVAVRLCNLANVLHSIDRNVEAEALYREAIAISEKAFGREHPDVAAQISIFATHLYLTERHAEAEPLLHEALTISQKTSGLDDPDAAYTQLSLATLYRDTGRMAEAVPHAESALNVYRRCFGTEHPITKECALIYASLLKSLGQEGEAAALLSEYGLNGPL